MSRRPKKVRDRVPWYRAKGYKGSLTEAEKWALDAFRMQEKHPATRYEDLPGEVQGYIRDLNLQVLDFRQKKAAVKPLLATAIGAFVIYLASKDAGHGANFGYFTGALLLTVPWLFFRWEWKRNRNELSPEDTETATHPIDEGIRRQWELEYISSRRGDHSVIPRRTP